ncbi:glutathione S-transferase family protein [Mesorhizobium sp. CGMCC 1.15528]|uniref:Glutathione S-transferase family protein n=1 Tax=Mesorhizobium zhangyense TaxID=1776730 RepID=A0A7C9VAQ1_9HYPH|nr:glutathione S-transferase family protein [Mesorhizobium zhangyense]NGN44103.1 glutathione S-transferase family protein [Mesorhizobium zhangyense]
MYKLYTRPGSGGFVVEAALELAAAPFERVNVIKSALPDPHFLEISPLGQVPVLTLPEGQTMTESAAMCILLAERHADAALAPAAGSPARADFLRWMAFLSSVLYPAVLRYYYAPRYTAAADGADVVKEAAIAEFERGLSIMDEWLEGRDWLAGDDFSTADVYLLMLAHWHPQWSDTHIVWPNIEQLCAALRQHPVILKLNITHELW